jgi:hypothetical protein
LPEQERVRARPSLSATRLQLRLNRLPAAENPVATFASEKARPDGLAMRETTCRRTRVRRTS